jgi:hypothetical protein
MLKKVSVLLTAAVLLCSTVAIDQSDARGGGGKRGGSSKSYSGSSYSYTPVAGTTQKKNVYFKNCTAAKKAGAAPIYKGQPGYRLALDRDKDGIACE